MLEGAYRKLKSYYFYNKNFLVMRKKITDFECDSEAMELAFEKMSEYLSHPRSQKSKEYMQSLLDKIDFLVLPKKFETDALANSKPITNTISKDKKLKTVNFFIDCPIEIYIFDTLWTVFLSKIAHENKIISYDVYGNTINASALFSEKEIEFDSRTLFNRYFYKYTNWRNNAFNQLDKSYQNKKDALLVSLDIKSYFYSVEMDFGKLEHYFGKSELFKEIRVLSNLIYAVYKTYNGIVSSYRKDLPRLCKKGAFLPIGLFSSMVLANVYLSKFDEVIKSQNDIKYYGRYVDDMLFVIEKSISPETTNEDIIKEVFIDKQVLKIKDGDYYISGYKQLCIQADKVKIIYINHNESRAIIDIFNDFVKVVPSQMDILYDTNVKLSSLDEVAYTVENFTKETKFRDLGKMSIDSFKVGSYFASLAHRYAHINVNDNDDTRKEISLQDAQIQKFFVGSQAVEYYTSWLNYMYFLVMTHRKKQLKHFLRNMKEEISKLVYYALDKKMYAKTVSINRKVKDALLEHLNICNMLALSIDIDMADRSQRDDVRKYINSNLFDHNLIAFPTANYLVYDKDVSLSKMSMKDIGQWPDKSSDWFKFKWSPRFIHYDELLLCWFYDYQRKDEKEFDYLNNIIMKYYQKINYMKYSPFNISCGDEISFQDYRVMKINIPSNRQYPPEEISIAVGSLNIDKNKCSLGCSRWENISLKDKKIFHEIFAEAIKCFDRKKKDVMILVLPELCFPVYWIGELARFAKQSQIAVITGLQYIVDDNKRAYNYVASFLPFTSGNKGFKHVFVHIREKNDYSPIEFEGLASLGYTCVNREIADYQVFDWNKINLSTIECFEMTDVVVRGLLKGRSDLIALPVFNPDTTYFSDIIDSTVRDLHAFIVQANTSCYGDSRVTGPYDRDSKDIFKIKGGDNDHVVIGSVKFKKVKDFEDNYDSKLQLRIQELINNPNKNKERETKEKPDIKPLSARFKRKQ